MDARRAIAWLTELLDVKESGERDRDLIKYGQPGRFSETQIAPHGFDAHAHTLGNRLLRQMACSQVVNLLVALGAVLLASARSKR